MAPPQDALSTSEQPARPAPGADPPGLLASRLRWWRTLYRLAPVPAWRLPVALICLAIIAAMGCIAVDDYIDLQTLDASTTATLLAVIAGAMATLTGLVFTAVTLAMQFGASQISVRVIPMLQRDNTMRWAIGVFLATFVFTLFIALDLAVLRDDEQAPGISTLIALLLTVLSAFLFIALVARVGRVLNSAQLLRWVENEGRAAIRRAYPDDVVSPPRGVAASGAGDETPEDSEPPVAQAPSKVITLRQSSSRGRVLLAIDLPRLQRLAKLWDVRVDLLVGIGDNVPHGVSIFEVRGESGRVDARKLLRCLLFGDSHRPSVSPAAALQSISDVALKALSPAINDPSRAVQAIDHIEDLLMMLSSRVRAVEVSPELSQIRGYRRGWADYVAIGTDQIRHYSHGAMQVQRRLRALFESLSEHCPPDQQEPLRARLEALDAAMAQDWTTPLDRWLASAADRQGFGTEAGGLTSARRLSISPRR